MEELFRLVGLGKEFSDVVVIGTLIMARIAAVVFQTPFLGGRMVPPETRAGISFGLTVLIYPFAKRHMSADVTEAPFLYMLLLLKEFFVGFVLGFIATKLFYAMEMAGRALDTMRGSNMVEVQIPELQFRASPLGDFSFHLLLLVFCALNGHGIFIHSLIDSFSTVPVDSWPAMSAGFGELVEKILHYSSTLFGIAFALVFPGLFASFMIDVVFGMLNKIAPQLNAYFMAMGIKALAGLAMFSITLGLFVKQLRVHLEQALVFIKEVVLLFA